MNLALRTQRIPIRYHSAKQIFQAVTRGDGSLGLSPAWLEMNNYAVGLPTAWTAGDKFECLVHELSHRVLNTDDVQHPRTGRVAYGGNLCRALARTNGPLAFTNADNWGFFIEEFVTFEVDIPTRGRGALAFSRW